MKLFKKLDNYLLHHYPSIWITRIHSFLPIGIGISLVLFLVTMFTGWNPKDDFPENGYPIILMIIPVLIYLIYWFIFQSRYNVAKSGGNMPVHAEYLNFFCYLLVFFTAFILISAIPLGNYQKVRNAIDQTELEQDFIKLNIGNTLVYGGGEMSLDSNNHITFSRSNFVWDDHFVREIINPETLPEELTITETEALKIIADFCATYNKYTRDVITKTPEKILADRFKELAQNEASFTNNYNSPDWSVQYKIHRIVDSMERGWYEVYNEPWLWKISVGIMAFFALMVWIFKQMQLRQFIFGLIAIVLTPLVIAIAGVILFGLLDIRHDEDVVSSGIILFLYVLFAIYILNAYHGKTLNRTGYVMTMYLQFFLPILPVFVILFFTPNDPYYRHNSDDQLEYLYWTAWLIGLLSIAIFKPVYAKFRSLPSKN